MSPSTPFIRRPIATILLTFGVIAAGMVAFFQLPVSPLPQVDYPTISVQAQLPGASPDVVATTLATPLERHLGQIADVTEMTSMSAVGSVRITLQFNINRDINGAARDVQAAISAARADMPSNLRSNPTYRKVNPADAPIMILALTSDTVRRSELYDVASTTLQQKLSQIDGIGEVIVSGSAPPAVRVELNPNALYKYGVGLEDVRAALASANAHAPKGDIEVGDRHYQIYDNDQAVKADDYRSLIVAYRNGAAIRLSDVSEVVDGNENIRNDGSANGKPSVLIILFRTPGANVIDTVDRVREAVNDLRNSIPLSIDVTPMIDRSLTIRASLSDVERTLMISVVLVIMVVFVFLRSGRATIVPAVAVPASLIGTFAAMYMLNYSLDNLSLMALTIATGFVVDDAIVVLENISRHIEAGVPRVQAAIRGAGEVAFTVLSMTLSLIAVFIPILMMGGYIGRLFREFAMTLSVALIISLAVSLATTPMMCALLLKNERHRAHGLVYRVTERFFDGLLGGYQRSLSWALNHSRLIAVILLGTVAANVWLFKHIRSDLFPSQDTGQIIGGIRGDQSMSFQLMQQRLRQFVAIIRSDPAVENVVASTGSTGGGGRGAANTGMAYIQLKALRDRRTSVDGVILRLSKKLSQIPGVQPFLQPARDIRVGGRQSNALYQYTLMADDVQDLNTWSPRIEEELKKIPILKQVNADIQPRGLETDIVIDRDTATRLGVTVAQIDNTLNDAFGQRLVSTIYKPRNQYHVVMELAPQYWQNPNTLNDVYVSKSGGAVGGTQGTNAVAGTVSGPPVTMSATASAAASIAADAARNLAVNSIGNTGKGAASTGAAVSTNAESMVPLSAVTHYGPGTTPLAVAHQGLSVASTISFNLDDGVTLDQAVEAIGEAMQRLQVVGVDVGGQRQRLPGTIRGIFAGTAQVYQEAVKNEPYLILAALIAIYIVLGVLYESYIHPITILSTLPSAGVGAVLALLLCDIPFTLIALIGVILLIGIVKKNAIMMIDFAIDAERTRGLPPERAIYEACLLRFRPIIMTTAAALLGAIPLAIGTGEGSEMRRPLGIAIVGGLILSQLLTLYTTPVVYIYLDRLRLWLRGRRGRRPAHGVLPDIPPAPAE